MEELKEANEILRKWLEDTMVNGKADAHTTRIAKIHNDLTTTIYEMEVSEITKEHLEQVRQNAK